MRGQVGSWDGYLAVTFNDDAMAWIDRQDCDRHVAVGIDLDRRILVRPDRHIGHHVTFRGFRNSVDYGIKARWDEVLGPMLTRFELLEVRFDENYGRLETKLPPDHLLPWPKVRPCDGYDCREVVIAELERRMRSALRAFDGDKSAAGRVMTPIPEPLRALLLQGDWSDAVRRASDRSTWGQ